MTREEAIFILRGKRDISGEKTAEALDIAIKAIEQEPCEDVISRQAVLSKIKEVCFSEEWLQFRVDKGSNGQRDSIIDYIEQLPPVVPQPKMGRWLHREIMDYLDKNKVIHNHFMCQDCGFIHDFIDGHTAQYKYCPSCGAKMQEVEK